MRPHYIAARRRHGRPSRHLTARRLRRMESRFYRVLAGAMLAASMLLYVLW